MTIYRTFTVILAFQYYPDITCYQMPPGMGRKGGRTGEGREDGRRMGTAKQRVELLPDPYI